MRGVLPLALLLLLAPFVVVAVRIALRDGAFEFAGDQAVIGLAVREASALAQELGPYSRYGWSHPGPSWYYALAPGAALFGRDDAALVAAGLLVHGLIAAVLVAVVHRSGRPVLTLVTALVVALTMLRLPATFLLDVWNPFALLLSTALLLVLASRARDGRWTTLLLLLITGSHLVQTHVGTAVLVSCVGLAGLVATALGRRDARVATAEQDQPGARGLRRWSTPLLGLLLAAMWLPPVVQQLTAPAGEGNLRRLFSFFVLDRQESVHPTVEQAVIAVGRLLAVPVQGWGPGPWEMDVSTLPASVALVFAGQVFAALALVVVGRRWSSQTAAWTGIAVLVALAAAVVSGTTVTGTLYWYLLVWVCVLPGVTAIGYAQLFLDRRDRTGVTGTVRRMDSTPVLAALAVALAVVVTGLGLSWSRGLELLPDSGGVRAAAALVEDALGSREPGTVYVDIHSDDRWPIGAGLIEDLAADGWHVRVSSTSADLYGRDRVGTGEEPVRLTLIAPDDTELPTVATAGGRDLGTVETENGPLTVFLEETP
ncbi:hypothetical protein [Modestobacter marinus]|uniref:Glycosyltransferase RgtA/B/C/D-like domain-containing protein n=1 Tax=Modestobacter marinus TaxID=477641 RepID=A0A846LQP0_9ACTN|nr:hypothetical protein [Modestobacter marinus]NIH67698.1 hypothetical protein [Modestobacter marinus]